MQYTKDVCMHACMHAIHFQTIIINKSCENLEPALQTFILISQSIYTSWTLHKCSCPWRSESHKNIKINLKRPMSVHAAFCIIYFVRFLISHQILLISLTKTVTLTGVVWFQDLKEIFLYECVCVGTSLWIAKIQGVV